MGWLLFAVVLASLSVTVVCTDDDWVRYGGEGQSMEPLMSDVVVQEPFHPTWLRYLVSRQSVVHPGYDLDAVDSGFTEPRKRNNGAWVWMPAQGYVSLPKNQQAVDAGSSGKHGKIMRYGK